jgi:WD40 repeat protein
MADAANRAQQAQALEEKRRRLEELKQRRVRRTEDTARIKAAASSNLDEYIDGLIKEPVPGGGVATETVEQQVEIQRTVSAEGPSPENDRSDSGLPNTPATATTTPTALVRQVETFTIATQTEDEDFPPTDDAAAETAGTAEPTELETIPTEATTPPLDSPKRTTKLLSEQEVASKVAVDSFTHFINTSSKKVDRVLGKEVWDDLLVDYLGETDGERVAKTEDNIQQFLAPQPPQVYECPKWTATRDITDLHWSPLHSDYFLATYHAQCRPTDESSSLPAGSAAVKSISASRDTLSSSLTPRSGELQSDGLALVWTLSLPDRPEHVFTCGSPVTVGRFHAHEATLVVGGCASGQLVVWDVRSGRLPVQKSDITVLGASGKGHTHPIQVMDIVEGGVRSSCAPGTLWPLLF